MNYLPSTPDRRPAADRPKPTRRIPRRLATLTFAIAAAGLPGCMAEEHLVIGWMNLDDSSWQSPRIPETATAGVPLAITVWTGGGGCYRHARTDATVTGRSADVVPRDYLTTGTVCTDDFKFIEHRTSLTFEEPGTAEITLRYSTEGDGWSPASHTGEGRKVYTVEVAPAG